MSGIVKSVGKAYFRALGYYPTRIHGHRFRVDLLTHTWDVFAPLFRSSRLDFIKIDIEGGEFSLLPSLAEYLSAEKPIVYLSTHAPFLDPSVRRERMQEIGDVLGVYGKCLDQDLESADRRTWAEDSTGEFRSFVFLD